MGWRAVIAVAVGVVLLTGLVLPQRALAAPYAAVVMDMRSGEILHARNHDTRLHPASLTKMMTLYVAFEAIGNGEISLDTMVTVSRRAASEVPSRLGLRAGQRIALRYLIRAAALRSGNDAATAIAEGISGSVEAFTARMNRTAAAIGMNNTRFLNAHGLTQAGHQSTARDMTLLGRQLYFDYPQYYNLFSRRTEHAGVARVRNTNWRFLDGYRGADGIKTGYTRAAGYNLTASAERNGVRIIVTVFGGRSVVDRHQRIVQLMDMGFSRAPARVATNRPSSPSYAAAAQTASASGGRQAAGRTIRLQTAPQRSLFPAPRPGPEPEAPPAAVVAALQEEIGAVLAEVAEAPAAEAAPTDDTAAESLAAAAEEAVTQALEPGAPSVSPLPVARPVEVAAAADRSEDSGLASRAATGPMDTLDGLVTAAPEVPADAAPAEAGSAPAAPAEEGFGQSTGAALAEVILPQPAPAPAATPAGTGEDSLPTVPPLAHLPVTPPAPQRFEHSARDIGPVLLQDGLVRIPGLPAIAIDPAMLESTHAEAAAGEDRPIRSTPVPQPAVSHAVGDGLALPTITQAATAERAPPGEDSPETLVVLTTSDASTAPRFSLGAQLPEIVTRATTGHEAGWVVRLGEYPSRFDAERALLRVTLAESGTLGRGGRRVGQRGGRFLADIENLTREQAELACGRLSVRAQPCEIIAP